MMHVNGKRKTKKDRNCTRIDTDINRDVYTNKSTSEKKNTSRTLSQEWNFWRGRVLRVCENLANGTILH